MINIVKPDLHNNPSHIGLFKDISAVVVLVLFTLFLLPIYTQTYVADSPKVENGIVDFTQWDFQNSASTLEGDWQFYWGASADEIAALEPEYLYVPGLWTEADPVYPLEGNAAYRLIIQGLEPGIYEVHFPMIYTASNIWLDGKKVSSTGVLGKTARTTRTVFKPHSVFISSVGQVHELVLEQATFHHRANGIEIVPVIGTVDVIASYKQLLSTKDMFLHAAFVILSLYGFVIYIFRREDRSSLYFGLFCGLAGISMLVMGVNVVELIFPDISLPFLLAILYIPFAAAYAFFALYIGALYPKERVPILSKIFVASFLLMAALHLVLLVMGRTMESSYIVPVLGLLGVPFFLYILSIMLRATLKGREGALILFLGTVIFVGFLTNDILVESNVLHRDQTILYGVGEFGVIVFLLTQVIILGGRWSRTLSRSERLTVDLSQLIDMSSAVASDETLPSLLGKIVQSGRRFLDAERGTLFLHDEETNELWSLVAEGVAKKEIRIPANEGIAGACFESGEIICVNNVYNDPRFLGTVDKQTGFVTSTILSVPIETKAGKRIGVMQVLNKSGGLIFDRADQHKLTAFSSQAAISLENADLFGKIVQSRKYNDNILASMSNGVISINKSNCIEKVNQAAVDIWGGNEDNYMGADAIEVLSKNNNWLAQELEQTSVDGGARSFIDVDIITHDAKSKAVNLSIVPLADQDDDMGLLIILEDITEDKRLKSTMSRFMTKEVADRILKDGGESLTGTSVTASILFADLRAFTSLTEKLGPQETVSMLNEFFGKMTNVIFDCNGVLDKFIGDSVMAVFGAPIENTADADNALNCAVQMMKALDELNSKRQLRDEPALDISVGIATGEVIAGTIGSAKRMEYTVVGDSVNLASRLEQVTRYYGANIIVSEGTLESVKESRRYRELDLIRVKGRNAPTKIYDLLEHHDSSTFPNGDALIKHYSAGLASYRNRQWGKAIDSFQEALRVNPDDRPSKIHLERSRLFSATPPNADWDGVWTMKNN